MVSTHRPKVAVVGDGGFVAHGYGDDLDGARWAIPRQALAALGEIELAP